MRFTRIATGVALVLGMFALQACSSGSSSVEDVTPVKQTADKQAVAVVEQSKPEPEPEPNQESKPRQESEPQGDCIAGSETYSDGSSFAIDSDCNVKISTSAGDAEGYLYDDPNNDNLVLAGEITSGEGAGTCGRIVYQPDGSSYIEEIPCNQL